VIYIVLKNQKVNKSLNLIEVFSISRLISKAKYFYISSQMHGKVIDIKKHKAEPGSKAVMYEKLDEPSDSQLWYENKHGLLANKLTDFVLDSSDGE